MTEFDPIKSMREELAGFRDAHAVILTRAREAERKFAEAEADHNALQKIEAFARHMMVEAQAKLTKLQNEAEQKKAPT